MPKKRQKRPSTSHGALAYQGCRGVQMADGNRQSVGRVGRLGYFAEIEQARDHVLHLGLLCSAITHHGGLDGKRRILGNFQPGRGRGQHGHSTHLPQLERGLYVQCVEHIFDGNIVRLVFLNDDAEPLEDGRQPPRQGLAGRELDGAAGKTDQRLVVTKLDDAETGVFSPAIDTQHAHGGSLSQLLVASCQLSVRLRTGNWSLKTDFLNNTAAAWPWQLRIPGKTQRKLREKKSSACDSETARTPTRQIFLAELKPAT